MLRAGRVGHSRRYVTSTEPVCACVCVCVCVRACECSCFCACACAYVRVRVHGRVHVCACLCGCMSKCVYTMCIHTYVDYNQSSNLYTHVLNNSYLMFFGCSPVCTDTYVCAQIYWHIYAHVCTDADQKKNEHNKHHQSCLSKHFPLRIAKAQRPARLRHLMGPLLGRPTPVHSHQCHCIRRHIHERRSPVVG